MSKVVLVDAKIKSIDELARRLIEGEVFWTEHKQGCIKYDKLKSNPFRYNNSTLDGAWGLYYSLKKEIPVSELNLDEKLDVGITCFALVSNKPFCRNSTIKDLLREDVSIKEVLWTSGEGYKDTTSTPWLVAKEVSIELIG